jgi:WD40 repeat protein
MISQFFEQQMELERQQREGGGGGGGAPVRHGRRSGSSRGSERPAWDSGDGDTDVWEPAPMAAAGGAPPDADGADDDAALLLRFYADVEPEYATPAKVQKIIGAFQRKAAKTGADWREWMYTDMAKKRGIDPREYIAAQSDGGGGEGGGIPAASPVGQTRPPMATADPRLALLARSGARDSGGSRGGRRGSPSATAARHTASDGGAPALAHGAGDWDQELRQQKLAVGSVGGGPGKYHAARSHEMNSAYANEWDVAYQELGGDGAPFREALTGGAPGATSGAVLGTMVERSPNGQGAAPSVARSFGDRGGWTRGPSGAPIVLDASDRNLMAMSIRGGKGVAACADHGLHCFDLAPKTDVDGNTTIARLARQLHSKRYGHADWVSVVATLPDGRVLSGGQDSKLCLWNASGVVCKDLQGHTAAISALGVGDRNTALSSSYDTTLRCWDLSSGVETACLRGHSAPVLDLAWARSGVAISGDRAGRALLWDVGAGTALRELDGHGGHVTVVCAAEAEAEAASTAGGGGGGGLFFTGAQDGVLRVWDLRVAGCVANCPLHNHGERGAGAIGSIEVAPRSGRIATAGADCRVNILDPRAGWGRTARSPCVLSDFAYSLRLVEAEDGTALALSGCGDGTVHAHSLFDDGDALWGVGAGRAAGAARAVGATTDRLVTAWDDGNLRVWEM